MAVLNVGILEQNTNLPDARTGAPGNTHLLQLAHTGTTSATASGFLSLLAAGSSSHSNGSSIVRRVNRIRSQCTTRSTSQPDFQPSARPNLPVRDCSPTRPCGETAQPALPDPLLPPLPQSATRRSAPN